MARATAMSVLCRLTLKATRKGPRADGRCSGARMQARRSDIRRAVGTLRSHARAPRTAPCAPLPGFCAPVEARLTRTGTRGHRFHARTGRRTPAPAPRILPLTCRGEGRRGPRPPRRSGDARRVWRAEIDRRDGRARGIQQGILERRRLSDEAHDQPVMIRVRPAIQQVDARPAAKGSHDCVDHRLSAALAVSWARTRQAGRVIRRAGPAASGSSRRAPLPLSGPRGTPRRHDE